MTQGYIGHSHKVSSYSLHREYPSTYNVPGSEHTNFKVEVTDRHSLRAATHSLGHYPFLPHTFLIPCPSPHWVHLLPITVPLWVSEPIP